MTLSPELARLLPFRQAREKTRLRLVCLPFAGGTAGLYRPWSTRLPDYVDVCAVELPGHGTRFGETPVSDVPTVTRAIRALDTLEKVPVVVFGHSLGARLGFSLVHGGMHADALMVSGSRAAHLAPVPRGGLTDAQLIGELRKLGGTPRQIMDDPEMLAAVLPVVRADFRLLENLRVEADATVTCPVTVLAAVDDTEAPLEAVEAWRTHAAGDFELVRMTGGHFFPVSRPDDLLAQVRRVVERTLDLPTRAPV